MALTEKDLVNLLDTSDVPVNILVVNCSPKAKSNSQVLVDVALEQLKEFPAVNTDTYRFAGKKIEACRHCPNYCKQHMECVYKDDYQEFREKWLWADGIVWVSPVYHMGPPSKVRSALDRLSEVEFHTIQDQRRKRGGGPPIYPKFSKAVGSIVHGATLYGGQEITIQYFVNHAVLLDCFPVSGDMPECYLGAAGHSPSREALEGNEVFLYSAGTVARRVAETAKMIKAGLMLAQEDLEEGWFPSKDAMGATDKEGFVSRMNAD